MKKILKFLLSRTFLFGLLIACQVGLFAALMLVFSRAGTVAYIILTLVSVLVVIAVIERDNINPAYKIMWLLIVVALPVTGAVFYLWWGNQGVTPKNARKFADIERAASAAMVQDDAVTEALYAREPAFRRSVEYLSRNASAPRLRQHAERVLSHGARIFSPVFWRSSAARRNISSWNILSLKKAKCGTKRWPCLRKKPPRAWTCA